jgi:rhodanese-related sulfurtransferase
MKAKAWSINIRAAVLFLSLTTVTFFANDRRVFLEFFTPPGDEVTQAPIKGVISAVNGRSALIIDVRPPERFRCGHILHAVNVPIDRLEADLRRFTNTPSVILYGQNQSLDLPRVRLVLKLRGMSDRAAIFEEGWDEWSSLGLPAASGPPAAAEAVEPEKIDSNKPLRHGDGGQATSITREVGLLQSMLMNDSPQKPITNVQRQAYGSNAVLR